MQKFIIFFLLLLPLQFTYAQVFPYHKKFEIGSGQGQDVYNLAIDKDDNFYYSEMSKVVKYKNGVKLLEFRVNTEDYRAGFDNKEGVYLSLVVDQNKFIYILNANKKRVEKHDQNGKLVKTFSPATNVLSGKSLSIYLDNNNNINLYDFIQRKLFVYDPEGNNLETITLADPSPYAPETARLTFGKDNSIFLAELKKSPWTYDGWSPEAHVSHIDRNGNFIHRFAPKLLRENNYYYQSSIYINADNNGDLYIYNNTGYYQSINVFSPKGSLKYFFPLGHIKESSIHFDSQNNMYIDFKAAPRDYIRKYNPKHEYIASISDLKNPYEVVFDKSNNLFMLDKLGNVKSQIVKYNFEGEEDTGFKLEISPVDNPLTFSIDDNGYFYVLGPIDGSTDSKISKFDSTGKFITDFTIKTGYYDKIFGAPDRFISAGLAVDKAGNIYVTAPNSGTHTILKLDPQGNEIAKIGPIGKEPGKVSGPLDLILNGAGNILVLDLNGNRIQKFSSDGKFINQFGSFDPNERSRSTRASIVSDAFGNVLVATQGFDALNKPNPSVKYYGLDGQLVYSAPLNTPCLAMNANGSIIATTDLIYDLVTVYGATSLKEYNLIEGTIFHDSNFNCIANNNENTLHNILVKAEPGPYYGITDSSGKYRVYVGEGSYTVTAVAENSLGKVITPTCLPDGNIIFDNFNQTSSNNNIGVNVVLSPYLTVSLSSNRRRRCMENLTTVSYSNTGYAPTAIANVTVQFPQEVIFKSASMPFTRDGNGNYVFSVGSLQPGQHGIISIIDSVSCADPNIRGLTVCTKAWITPANSYPESSGWNKADIALSAAETGNDQARFVLRNKGLGDMADSLFYRVFEDQQLLMDSKYLLASGDSAVLRIPTAGRVLRMEADQPQGHPIKTRASVNLEMRAKNDGLPDIGMMALPPDDPEPEITESCLPIIDSYDPNDKQVVPAGFTPEFYTPTNTPLRYTVRFQNTGTDVAYRVVVVDTLSADLDISTFRVGAVSHPYRLSVTGKVNPVLTFTFDNIMLPDSSADQAGSNGFIEFSAMPKADLPEKHLIENLADIYFDFNEPIRTNTTQNRLYDMPSVLSTRQLQAKDVLVSPSLTTFSPAQGRVGSFVTLTGKNFSAMASRNHVTFNGVAAQIHTASATELKVVVPQGAFTGKVKVLTLDGAANSVSDFTVFQAPTISSLSVLEGTPGALVTINGTHFSPETAQDTVLFNGVEAVVKEATATQLKVEVPATALKGKVLIKTLGGQVQSSQDFMVWHQPIIANVTPEKGKIGTVVTLTGANFSEVVSRNKVSIGTVAAEVTQATKHSLTVIVPFNAQSGKVQVQTPGGTASSATDFIFIPEPIITSFSPKSGNAGTRVTIIGQNFGADGQADQVFFNGLPAQVVEATQASLVVQAPKYLSTGRISITGAGGEALGAEFLVLDLTNEDAILVYPNPSRGVVTVNWHKANYTVEKIRVYDSVGRLVSFNDRTGLPQDEIILPYFGVGVYSIRVQTSEGPVIKRLVVL